MREYVDAFRAEGLHVGFYYSLIDWHHPEFPIDRLHPRRDDPDAEEQSRGRDVHKYAEYMRNQVTELDAGHCRGIPHRNHRRASEHVRPAGSLKEALHG